jgi:hypothetical protein
MEALYEGGLVVGTGVVEELLLPPPPGTGEGFNCRGDGEVIIGVGVVAADDDDSCCFC